MLKTGKLKKEFEGFQTNLINHCLVEKTWQEFEEEIKTKLDEHLEQRTCDNYRIVDFDEENYDVHIVVADSVYNMYVLYVKVLKQKEEAKSS